MEKDLEYWRTALTVSVWNVLEIGEQLMIKKLKRLIIEHVQSVEKTAIWLFHPTV
jgi:hypothetical protein